MTQEELLACYRAQESRVDSRHRGEVFDVAATPRLGGVWLVRGRDQGAAITRTIQDAVDWIAAHGGVLGDIGRLHSTKYKWPREFAKRLKDVQPDECICDEYRRFEASLEEQSMTTKETTATCELAGADARQFGSVLHELVKFTEATGIRPAPQLRQG